MTSLQLLFWIVGGIVLQVAVYLGIVLSQQWARYRALGSAPAAAGGAAGNAATGAPLAAAPAQAAPVAQSFRNMRVVRRETEDALGEVCSFYLAPEDGQALAPFLPGQFLTFRLDIATPLGTTERVVRCYSLSDAPRTDGYRVTIKRVPAPAGTPWAPGRSSHHFHDHVAEGSVLQVRAPSGQFHLDRSDAPVVLIAGGIGITPMLSMVQWSLAAQPGRELWLFYGVRRSAELVMAGPLEQLAAQHPNFHLHLCFSDAPQSDLQPRAGEALQRHASRVTVPLLRSLLPLKPYHFYLCGPTPMLQSLVPAMEDWGVPDERIHFEAFGPASIPRRKAASPAQGPAATAAAHAAAPSDTGWAVRFATSGKEWAWSPGTGSLLDFAEAHGIAVSSGCRAGNCGSCQTAIRSGQVAYSQTPDFDPGPGHCLLCLATPASALTLEA